MPEAITGWDGFVAVVLLLSVGIGAVRGLVRTVFALGAWAVALLGVPVAGPPLARVLPEGLPQALIFLSVFLLLFVAVRMLGSLAAKALHGIGLGGADRLLGATCAAGVADECANEMNLDLPKRCHRSVHEAASRAHECRSLIRRQGMRRSGASDATRRTARSELGPASPVVDGALSSLRRSHSHSLRVVRHPRAGRTRRTRSWRIAERRTSARHRPVR
jgi:hypothetical protein